MQRVFCTFATNFSDMTEFNQMQKIKRNLFAMRNGIVADTLRKAGSPFPIIFGVNLPQLDEIAAATGKSEQLACELFNDCRCRESMLIAPMLMPIENMSQEMALEWLAKSKTAEVTDVLCHKLLRKLPDASVIVKKALGADTDMVRYGGIRLLWNLLPSPAKDFKKEIQKEVERNCPLTRRVAESLLEELDFLESI